MLCHSFPKEISISELLYFSLQKLLSWVWSIYDYIINNEMTQCITYFRSCFFSPLQMWQYHYN